MLRSPTLAVLAGLLVSGLSSPLVSAEAATGPADVPAVDPAALPPVVIGATKVEAEVGEVPASVVAVSGQQIDDRGDRTLDDLAGQMANVHAINLGTHTTYPVIRGVSGLPDHSPTAVVIDGVAPRGLGLDSLLDVEQVEVLRGPQGTLYGRDSLPGVVNVATREPGKVWEGYGTLDGGSRRSGMATVAAGGPLSDALGVRLATRGAVSDGWRTDTLDGADDSAPRHDLQAQGTLAYDLGDGWRAKLTGLAARYRSTGDQFAPPDLAEEHETANDHAGEFSQRALVGGLTITRRSGERTLTSITGVSATRDVFDLDADFSPAPVAVLAKTTDDHLLSQELRYAGGHGLRSWLVGLFASREKMQVDAPLDLAAPVALAVRRGGEQTQVDLAAFGQAGLPLGPGWTLTLGLRAESVRTAVDYRSADNLTPGFSYSDDRTDTVVLPKASLAYAWSDDVLSWVSATRGFIPGGYNLVPGSPDEIADGVDPETAWSYELGQRVTALDRRLRVSLVGFWMDWRDKQVTVLQPPSTFLLRNAASATVIGIENDNALRIADGLDLVAGLGVLRATFDEFDAGGGADLAGNRLPMAPSYDGYIGLQWRGESGLFVRGDLAAIGSYYAEETDTIDQHAYQLLGARVGYEAEYWAVYVYGRNLSDEVYWTRGSMTQDGRQVVVTGEPRTFGATGTMRF